jgi:hypothetical protein
MPKWRKIVLLLILAFIAFVVESSHPRTFLCFLVPAGGLVALFYGRSKSGLYRLAALFLLFIPMVLIWPWSAEIHAPIISRVQDELSAFDASDSESGEDGIEPLQAAATSDSAINVDRNLLETKQAVRAAESAKTREKHYTLRSIWRRGPALVLGFPLVWALVFARRDRRTRFLCAGAFMFLALWAVSGYLFGSNLGYRCLYFYGFFMQAAVASLIWFPLNFRPATPRSVLPWALGATALAVVLIVGTRVFVIGLQQEFGGTWRPLPHDELARVAHAAGNDNVLAGPQTTYSMFSFGLTPVWEGRVISTPASKAVREWLLIPTGSHLLEAARDTRARWLLIDKDDQTSWGPPVDAPVVERLNLERFILYEILTDKGIEGAQGGKLGAGDRED